MVLIPQRSHSIADILTESKVGGSNTTAPFAQVLDGAEEVVEHNKRRWDRGPVFILLNQVVTKKLPHSLRVLLDFLKGVAKVQSK